MITCDPNDVVRPIHPKAMITVLEAGAADTWLGGSYDDFVRLQRPYDPAHMTIQEPVFPTRQDGR